MKYGGKQSIFPKDEDYHVPLKYIGALTYMMIRRPTRKELNELPIVDLTDSTIWNPRLNETETEIYGHQLDELGQYTNTIHL
jgi:hypothetical protein